MIGLKKKRFIINTGEANISKLQTSIFNKIIFTIFYGVVIHY